MSTEKYKLSDLVNVPVTHSVEVWVNFYPGEVPYVVHEHREDADQYADSGRIACKKFTLTFEEGEGLKPDRPHDH